MFTRYSHYPWTLLRSLFALTISATMMLSPADAAGPGDPADLRSAKAFSALEQVMREDQSWAKIHAAESLSALGRGDQVRSYILSELAGREPAECRVGVWRVLANVAPTPEDRNVWIAKIVAVFLDPAASDRAQALESLSKLGYRSDGEVLAEIRKLEASAPPTEKVMFAWARFLAGDKTVLAQLTQGLESQDPVIRRRSGYILRWIQARDEAAMKALVNAANAAEEGSELQTFLGSAVLALKLDESNTPAWVARLKRSVREGASGARLEASQALINRLQPSDLPAIEDFLSSPDADTRVATAHLTLATLQRAGEKPGRVITLGGLPLLFVDDAGVETRHNLVRLYHQGKPAAEPILAAETPWEGERVYVYGTVRYDAPKKLYEMWYIGVPARGEIFSDTKKVFVEGFREGGAALMLYATSRDGVKWDRPNLGLHAFGGSKANNILFDLDSVNVVVDARETDPAQRYKLVGYSSGGYWSAVSPDGLKWKDTGPRPILPDDDTVTMTRDPATGEFLVYHKKPQMVRGFDRRVVWLSRSKDFKTWSEPKLVLSPDAVDDAWCTRPEERTEFYNMSVFPHAGGYIGLPTIFRVEYELQRGRTGPGQSRWNGPIDVEIASSVDGERWQRAYPRINLIPHGAPGEFNSGAILGLASDPVNAGAQTWIYYSVLTTDHGGPMPPKRIAIARAGWRRDGFVSLEVGPEGGTLLTRPVRFETARLVVNAEAQRGQVRASIVELDGRAIEGLTLADCEPLTRDAIDGVVKWKSGRQPPTDRPVRMNLEVTSARLFSVGSGLSADVPGAAP